MYLVNSYSELITEDLALTIWKYSLIIWDTRFDTRATLHISRKLLSNARIGRNVKKIEN